MPATWVRRDPDNPGQIWDELSEEVMSAKIRRNNPDSPCYVPPSQNMAALHLARVTPVDRHTVRVGDNPRDVYRLEFDLYEGWAEQGRTEPAPLALTEPAYWLGMSVLDYLAASGAATATARRMVTTERKHALKVATPLVAAFTVLLENMKEGKLSPSAREWHRSRCETLQAVVLDVLGGLTAGSMKRAGQLLDEAVITRAPLSEALDRLRDVWRLQDYAARFPAEDPAHGQ